jgi:hypothetical protein
MTNLSRRRSDNPRVALLYALTKHNAGTHDALLDRALASAASKLERAASTLDTAKGYPRLVASTGNWEQRPKNQWTSGFFAGTLWYMYQATHDAKWRALAERWTAGLESNKTITTTHDLGFMIFNSFGRGYLLTGDQHYGQVILDAATSLVTRYNPKVGAIKSWDTESQTDRRRDWKFPVIVDNLMNLDLLFWSASHGGKPAWEQMAEQHALTTARTMQRADGSMAHVGLFDPVTGNLERTTTWQGYSDSSAWARGQAWAIHGFTNAYGRTKNPVLLTAAQKAADYFIANLPPDAVPYWDFRDPGIPNVERDASAAAVAASGLFDLSRRSTGAAADRYRTAAERILVSLATNYMAGPASAAVLEHSVGGRPQNVEVDVGLAYADYYFVEALLRRKGLFLE